VVDGMTVCQVAFSVLDLERTLSWYQDAFGFVASGGNTDQGGPEVAAMQGLPACRCDMAWLVDDQDFFQLEFFRYAEPTPKPRPYPSSESDIGYTVVGLHVTDLDAVLRRLSDLGTPPVSPVTGTGPQRRFLVRDPEGVLLQVMEDDLRGGGGRLPAPAGVRSRWRAGSSGWWSRTSPLRVAFWSASWVCERLLSSCTVLLTPRCGVGPHRQR
jgi:catechol 2,3-dioxygenase-like lactoylglutathione lyase family enzyme